MFSSMKIIKRNGSVEDFDISRVEHAILSAYHAADIEEHDGKFDDVLTSVSSHIADRFKHRSPHIEEIQDIVEEELVAHNQYKISKAYILYRDRRRQKREEGWAERQHELESGTLQVHKRNGRYEIFDSHKIIQTIERLADEYISDISIESILHELPKNIFDGISSVELGQAIILATTALIEHGPAYSYLAARLLLQLLYRQTAEKIQKETDFDSHYRTVFVSGINKGIEASSFTPEFRVFNLNTLAVALKPERDKLFTYLGIQTLYERYFVSLDGHIIENPQAFWMRVAMGLALTEQNPNERAIEFYETLSTMRFVCSTPTLFHSGLVRPQLSSCYLSTVDDDLTSIFKIFSDNAQLSKWSGGIGNDWTSVRATGAYIKSTHVESQGVIPFLKIANDTTVAINRSGKRRGATCAYLETWHLDIEDFLDLRRNTGDDRRRTHDMNTANWIPDLFIQRVRENGKWTLFSPDETSDLHDLYGQEFAKRYHHYEEQASAGAIHRYRVVDAVKLWRKMLTRLFETGHPWITFKDPSNIRSPQDHCGVIHNSNLCTEVLLNNSTEETAVCNLGSINLANHMVNNALDKERLQKTIRSAIRMLDNVIDINYYPTQEAKLSNQLHRPIGLGVMGFQDALFMQRVPFEDARALTFADESMEFISYHAIMSSSLLAKERGAYESYAGSKWDRGIFPIDTLDLLSAERGESIRVNREERMDWKSVRAHVAKHGMRNSNTMAIAPTATISNISGCFPCIEPIYKNLYVKSNMNGEFTIINKYLVADLKTRGLWNHRIIEEMKYYDGNINMIDRIPKELKELYKVSFDINPLRLIDLTAIRGKWIDQSQSHNVFVKGSSGKQIHDIYMHAWESGLKTTYYLRSLAASQIEKSTLSAEYGYTQKRMYEKGLQESDAHVDTNTDHHAASQRITPIERDKSSDADNEALRIDSDEPLAIQACDIDDPSCEACQ